MVTRTGLYFFLLFKFKDCTRDILIFDFLKVFTILNLSCIEGKNSKNLRAQP